MSDSNFETPERARGAGPRDGIEEEDHPIPLWFNLAWVATWLFGLAYMLWYVGFADTSARTQYAAELAAAARNAPPKSAAAPTSNPYKGDSAALAEGAQTFATICIACHGPEAHGLVGPSLVDHYWKYGESDADRFHSVMEGRPGGMPAWGPQLGSEKVWKVLAYVDSLPKSDRAEFGAPDYSPPPAPAP
jgi:cytochrome c oxidase cbb3-type subunit III